MQGTPSGVREPKPAAEAKPPASEGDTRRLGWILVLVGVLLVLIALALIFLL